MYIYPLLTYRPHRGEGEITGTYIPIWAHTYLYIPWPPIWGSSPPLYLYIVTYPYRAHGSVDVHYSPMTILDHLFRGEGIPYTYIPRVVTYPSPPTHKGAAGIISTFLHAHNVSSNTDIATPTHPQGGCGDHLFPWTCRPIPFEGDGGGQGVLHHIYIYIHIYIIYMCVCVLYIYIWNVYI